MAIATTIPIRPAAEPLSSEELHAWRSLMFAHASLVKRLDGELDQAHGLPLTSFEVLQHLEEAVAGRMRMCDLAASIQLSRSGLTRLVDRLERDGLLERCSCSHDARGAYACLTDAGRAQLASARDAHLAQVREHFLSRFDAGELALLGEMLGRVRPNVSCD